MQLTRIHIAQFRKFRDAIEIRDLDPGLNLFTGPNEVGKSTIATAIRAAFFERHRSSAIEDFRPSAERQATPMITLEFITAGTHYSLFKRFLGRARCTLEFGTHTLDGEAAEDHLAQLLGYQYASRGRSKADYWGIPGLLWTEQGRTQDLDIAIAHALAHLRAALGDADTDAQQASSQIVEWVARARNDLLTPSSAAPRGAYAQCLKEVQRLEAEYQAVGQEVTHYRQAVDKLAQLQAAHRADETEQPWQALRAQQEVAQAQLDEVAQFERALQNSLRQQQQQREAAALFQDQLQQLVRQRDALNARHMALQEAQHAWEQAKTEAVTWQRQQDEANTVLLRAQQILEQCRARDQHTSLQQQQQSLARELADVQHRLEQADAAHQTLQVVQTQLAGVQVSDEDLVALRKLSRQRSELQIRQQVHATRLQFTLEPGVSLTLDGQTLQGTGQRDLTAPVTLHVPGTGTLHIQPGGEGLDDLRQQQTQLDAACNALLRQLHAPSLQDVETRHAQAAALRADCVRHEQVLRLHAPEGTDALRRRLAALQAQRDALDTRMAQEPPQIEAIAAVSTAQAQTDYQRAQTVANAARERQQQAQLALGAAQARHAHALAEWRAAQAAMDAQRHQQQSDQYQRRLVDANAELRQVQVQIQRLQEKISQTRADILAQDVARYARSADQLWQTHQQRHETLLRLDAELQTLGARGLDERQAVLAQDLAQARRRADELARRALALDHLLQLLRDAQRSATQALQQPLQVHIRHYLDLLFPGAQLGLDNQLTPDSLRRTDAEGQRQELLHMLSHGAREQLGLIGRLACADLLRHAGRPTLLILDDALVHTDGARLAQMKRILFDAATRHQILLFSCHDTWWRDMGIVARDVGALAAVTKQDARMQSDA